MKGEARAKPQQFGAGQLFSAAPTATRSAVAPQRLRRKRSGSGFSASRSAAARDRFNAPVSLQPDAIEKSRSLDFPFRFVLVVSKLYFGRVKLFTHVQNNKLSQAQGDVRNQRR